jgi:hypothetical protein
VNDADRTDAFIEEMHSIGDDTDAMTQAESLAFYEAVARDASAMADLIRSEMNQ